MPTGRGSWNPLEPFNEAMRIAVPLVINQRNLDAQKQRADQLYELNRQKLLDEAMQAQKKVAVESSGKILESYLSNFDPSDPASTMKITAAARSFEKELGQPILPRDEAGEYAFMKIGKQKGEMTDYQKESLSLREQLAKQAQLDREEARKDRMALRNENQENKSPIIDKVDKGDHWLLFMRDGTTRREDKNLPPQKGEQGTKPPKDHIYDQEEGKFKLLENTPTYRKEKDAYTKDTFRFESITSKLDLLEKSAMELVQHPGIEDISGFFGSKTPDLFPAARDAAAKLKSLGSKVAIQAISEMREASKTGGALGNTSDADIVLLKESIASLDRSQSPKEIKAALEQISDVARASKNRMQKSYQTQWGDFDTRIYRKPIETKNLDIRTADDFLKKYGGK